MKAGCAPRWIITACPTPTSPTRNCKEGNLRAKYDVIIFPHVGGTSASMINGIAMTGNAPIPYKKTDADAQPGRRRFRPTISAAAWASKVLQELAKFVQQGGTLITEGSTARLMAEYDLAGGVTVEHPAELFARGSILRGVFSRPQEPHRLRLRRQGSAGVLQPGSGAQCRGGAGGFGGFGGGGGGRGAAGPINGGQGQNVTPNAMPIHTSPLDPADATASHAGAARGGRWPRRTRRTRQAAGSGGRCAVAFGGGRGASRGTAPPRGPAVPANANDMLLSGTLGGGEAIAEPRRWPWMCPSARVTS